MSRSRPVRLGRGLTPGRLKKLDGRLGVAQAYRRLRAELVEAFGGEAVLSPQRAVLLDRAVYLTFRLETFESASLAGKPLPVGFDVKDYPLWVSTLRRVLESLGLVKVPKDLGLARPVNPHAEAVSQLEREHEPADVHVRANSQPEEPPP